MLFSSSVSANADAKAAANELSTLSESKHPLRQALKDQKHTVGANAHPAARRADVDPHSKHGFSSRSIRGNFGQEVSIDTEHF